MDMLKTPSFSRAFLKEMIHSCSEVNDKKQELCEYLENQIEFQNLKGHKREMKVIKRNTN